MTVYNPPYSFNQSGRAPLSVNLSKYTKGILTLGLIVIGALILHFSYQRVSNISFQSQKTAIKPIHHKIIIPQVKIPQRVMIPQHAEIEKVNAPLEISLKLYSNFTQTLLKQGIHISDIENIKKATHSIVNLDKLHTSYPFDLSIKHYEGINTLAQKNFDAAPHYVDQISFYMSPAIKIIVKRVNDTYKAEKIFEKIYEQSYLASGRIRSSFSADASRAGIPNSMLRKAIKLFSLNIDFRNLQKNDTFEFGFNKFTDKNGDIIGHGSLNYASLTVDGKQHAYYRIEDAQKKSTWFNANGTNSKPLLMKTPIDGARLSSRFGMRRHPVLGYTKQHTGVDFAAPRGTPIYAAGDGVIVKKYRSSSYGNYIKIRHNKTFDTAYAHMSRFAHLKQGDKVTQGQVIGYVGTTGRSTGPHLHYEVHRKSVPINPHSSKVPTVSTFTKNMKKQLRIIKAKLAKLRAKQDVKIVHNSIRDIQHKLL